MLTFGSGRVVGANWALEEQKILEDHGLDLEWYVHE